MNLLSTSWTEFFTIFSDQVPLPREARTPVTPQVIPLSLGKCLQNQPSNSCSHVSLFYDLALEVKHHHFCHIVLVPQTNPDLIREPCKGMNTRKLGSVEATLEATTPTYLGFLFVQVTHLSRPCSLIYK